MSTQRSDSSRRREERVQAVIDRSNLQDLSVENILAAFRERDITSLEELVGQLKKAMADPRGGPQPIDFSAAMGTGAGREDSAVRHAPPKIPFVWNGTTYDPAGISRLDGQAAGFLVHYVGGRPEMYVISDPHQRGLVVQTLAIGRLVGSVIRWASKDFSESPGNTGPHTGPVGLLDSTIIVSPPPFSQGSSSIPPVADLHLWSDDNFQGSGLTVPAGKQYSDLTGVYRFWPFTDWNDCISSAIPCSSACLFWEHVGFGGSFLLVNLHLGVRNFEDFGWNDRISSVQNFG